MGSSPTRPPSDRRTRRRARRPVRRGARIVAATAASAVLATSCSSSGDERSSTSAPTVSEESTPTATDVDESETSIGPDDDPTSAADTDPAPTESTPSSAGTVTEQTPSTAAPPSTTIDDSTEDATDDSSDDDLQATAASFVPQLSDRECPGEPPDDASCSWIEVPADWSSLDGEMIRLPVTVIAASSADPAPDPIVVPAGGPGFDAARNYNWTNAPFNEERDIVLYDQRGTGLAEPSLDCPGADEAFVANLRRDESFEVERAAIVDATIACRERLEADGVDLDDYDSVASALDLDAIRRALGHDEWNILGVSYGARLALVAMRTTPVGIRSVVLDSVYDVTTGGTAPTIRSAERAYGVLADACAADPDCAANHDVTALIEQVVTDLDAEPALVEADVGDGPETFVITGGDTLAGLFNAMYDAALIPALPSIIGDLADREFAVVPELIRSGVAQGTAEAEAMQLAVDCADNAGLDDSADDELIEDPGTQRLLAAVVTCSEWPVEPTSADFNQPIVSDIPALVLAGSFDPITPPDGTEAVADRLPNATFALFPTAAHGVIGPAFPCAEQLMFALLDDPEGEIDTSCVGELEPLDFAD